MGFDAFGLPAENAAIEKGVPPAELDLPEHRDDAGADEADGLLASTGAASSPPAIPEYYGQQQALFLDMLEAGLVTRKAAVVNWDPVDMTVLANEQVIDGKGWRSGAPVERRELTQWFFRISDMAEELLEALDGLEHWPEKVRLMQRNWIGKSRGLQFRFATRGAPAGFEALEVYTTRPDTLWGASFAAVSPEHPLAKALEGDPAVAAFLAECRQIGTSEEELETAEKKGYDTGIRVVHPLDPGWELPVYIANFILMDYGTGAIFGCPAHDQRDLDFARKYGLPVIDVYVAARGPARGWRPRPMCRRSRSRSTYLRPVAGARHHDRRRGRGRRHRLVRGAGHRRRGDQVPPARLGPQPPALLGLPDPGDPLRRLRDRAGEAREPAGAAARRRDLRQAGQPARAASDLGADRRAPPAAAPPGARPTRWTPSSTRPGTSRASPRRTRRRRPACPTPTTG